MVGDMCHVIEGESRTLDMSLSLLLSSFMG